MISLLRFLMEAQRNGRIPQLNERTIGQEVFEREQDWDPSTDTIVRSETRRLRNKLQSYYGGPGANDPVRIEIPRGGYAPRCEWMPGFPVRRPEPSAAPVLPQPPSSPAVEAGRRPYISWLALALTIVCAALAIARLRRAPPGPSAQSFTIRPLTAELGQEFSPALSPDGRRIAYTARLHGSETRIYVKAMDDHRAEPFTAAGLTCLFPAWSPDGETLAYLQAEDDRVLVRERRVAGGEERTVAVIAREVGRWSEDPSPLLGNPGPAWLPDGKHLLVSDNGAQQQSGLVIVGDDGARRRLTLSPNESRDFYPRISPDGSTVAFVRYFSHGSSDIYTVPLAGGAPVRITHEERTIQGIAWEHEGRSLIASWKREGSFELWRVPLQGVPVRLALPARSPGEPSIAASGAGIAFVESTENWNIWRAPIEHNALGTAALLLSSSGRNYDPRYSPDGSQIAFISDRSGSMQLWTAGADGADPKQRTSLGGNWMGGIAWSPDGRTIAFDARPDGHSAVYFLDLGTGAVTPLDPNRFEERMPSYSRDGASLYFNSTRGGPVGIWRFDLRTHAFAGVPSPPGVFSAAESFDGRTLVYGGRFGEVWLASPPGTAPRRWNAATVVPGLSWMIARSGTYYTVQDKDGSFRLCHTVGERSSCLRGRMPGVLVPNAPDIAVSADERWVLFPEQDNSSGDIKLAVP